MSIASQPQPVAGIAVRPRMRLAVWAEAHATLLLFSAVFIVGFFARYYGVASMPYWLDEITTVTRSSLPFWDMIADSLAHHHLPSYFMITSVLASFGTTEAILRIPSVIFGSASCAVLFLIGRQLGGWRAGLIAGMLLALSPLQVQYGQEARSYSFVICMMAIGLLGLVELARDPRAAAAPWRDPSARHAPWVLYTLGTLAALNVLSVAFFWLISANLAALAIAFDARVDRRRFLLRWLAAQAIVLAFTLPWFVAMTIFTHGYMGNATNWVPALTLRHFFSTISSLYLMRTSRLISFQLLPAAIPGFGAAIVVFAAMGLAYLQRQPVAGAFQRGTTPGLSRTMLSALAIAAFVPPLTILLISFVKPLWMPRYLLWSSVPFLLFVGLGVSLLPRGWQNGAAFALILLAAINLAPYYRAETKPRWDLAGQDLRQAMLPGDVVLVSDGLPVYMMNFFLKRQGDEIPADAWTLDVYKAAQHLSTGGRVWVLFGRVGQADRTSEPNFARIIEPLGQPILQTKEGDLITMKLFAGLPTGTAPDCGTVSGAIPTHATTSPPQPAACDTVADNIE
jgi:mannosyltransferase